MEVDLSGKRWNPNTVSIVSNTIDNPFEEIDRVFDSFREFFEWIIQWSEEQGIDVRDRLSSHTEYVSHDPSNTSRSSSVRFNRRRMIMGFECYTTVMILI